MLSFHHFSGNKIVSILLTIVVIGVNLYFVVAQVETLNIEGGLLAVVCMYFILVVNDDIKCSNIIRLIVGIFAVLYILFNIYLVIHMAACMGNKRLMNSRVSMKKVTVWSMVVCVTYHRPADTYL